MRKNTTRFALASTLLEDKLEPSVQHARPSLGPPAPCRDYLPFCHVAALLAIPVSSKITKGSGEFVKNVLM